ncbi:MAG: FecR family protein, partial [Opitutaceae bacterium]
MNRTAHRLSPRAIDLTASDWIVRRNFGLTAAEESELECWQAADPRHAEALNRHDEAWTMLDRPRNAGRGDLMVRELGRRATHRRRRRRAGVGVAAAIAFAACGVIWQMQPVSRVPSIVSTGNAVLVLPEKRMLPDGSIVELRVGARIDVDFSRAVRRVSLQSGEAHFQVTKNVERPFVVTVGNVDVRAVGTAFAVQRGNTAIEVFVTEGRVAIEKQSATFAGTTAATTAESVAPATKETLATVDAGNRLRVEVGAAATTALPGAMTAAELAERLAWRAPRLEFSAVPLADAVALMNRHSSVRIEIADPVLARVPINGLFRADNTETFVRLIEASCGAKAER